MPIEAPLENVARRLNTTTEKLMQFHDSGWIDVRSREGSSFVDGRDEYKARFILHLERSLQLGDDQIAKVLEIQEPPYTLQGIDRILAQPAETA